VEPTWVSIRLFQAEEFDRSQVCWTPAPVLAASPRQPRPPATPSLPPTLLIAATPDAWFRIFLDRKSAPWTLVGRHSTIEAFALIFERGYTGKAEIRWLHRDGDI
jgi:hypothetical protein